MEGVIGSRYTLHTLHISFLGGFEGLMWHVALDTGPWLLTLLMVHIGFRASLGFHNPKRRYIVGSLTGTTATLTSVSLSVWRRISESLRCVSSHGKIVGWRCGGRSVPNEKRSGVFEEGPCACWQYPARHLNACLLQYYENAAALSISSSSALCGRMSWLSLILDQMAPFSMQWSTSRRTATTSKCAVSRLLVFGCVCLNLASRRLKGLILIPAPVHYDDTVTGSFGK